MTVAAFELIPTDQIYEFAFDSDPDAGKQISEKFIDLGFVS